MLIRKLILIFFVITVLVCVVFISFEGWKVREKIRNYNLEKLTTSQYLKEQEASTILACPSQGQWEPIVNHEAGYGICLPSTWEPTLSNGNITMDEFTKNGQSKIWIVQGSFDHGMMGYKLTETREREFCGNVFQWWHYLGEREEGYQFVIARTLLPTGMLDFQLQSSGLEQETDSRIEIFETMLCTLHSISGQGGTMPVN